MEGGEGILPPLHVGQLSSSNLYDLHWSLGSRPLIKHTQNGIKDAISHNLASCRNPSRMAGYAALVKCRSMPSQIYLIRAEVHKCSK